MKDSCVEALSHAPRIDAKGRSLLLGAASLIMVFGLAACGSSSTGAKSNAGNSVTKSAPTTQCTIPQNNGGDHDADNNGAPSDGDGCDR
jgi:hypothetical protein